MTRISSILLIICSLLCCFVSCGHEHNWSNPTCITPKTCYNCGETEGNVSEHSFGSWTETKKGNCTIDSEQKRTCQYCQYEETQTIPSSHDYSYGICTKCKDPLIDIKLPGRTIGYCVTEKNKNNVSVSSVKWNSIIAIGPPNTYHCEIGISMYQTDFFEYTNASDIVKLTYVITDSSGNIIFEKSQRYSLLSSRIHDYEFRFNITVDPNETYELSIKIGP